MSGFPYPGVIVEPQGQSTVVSITDKNGNVVTGYADAYAITPISFPDTISSRTTFYLPGEGPWTVSAKVSGIELAGSSLTLEGSEIATATLAAPLPPQSGAFVPQAETVTDNNAVVNGLLSIAPPTRAPFRLLEWSSGPQSDSSYNHWYSFGMNAALQPQSGGVSVGSLVTSGATAWYMAFEDGWLDPGTGQTGVEWYLSYWSADHTTTAFFRPIYTRVRSDINSAHHANIYFDIGTDGSGQLAVSAGSGTTLFEVDPNACRNYTGLYQLWATDSATNGGLLTIAKTAGLGTTAQINAGDNNSWRAVQISNSGGDVTLGSASITTSAAQGFAYISAASGAPTGTPYGQAGFVPMYYDKTNHKLWIYDSGWKGVVVS